MPTSNSVMEKNVRSREGMVEEFVSLRGRKRHRPEESHPDQRILRYRRKRWNKDGEFDDDDYIVKASSSHHTSLQTVSEAALCNGSLTTTTQHDSGIFGNMFDIKTSWKSVLVTGFDLLSDASQVEYEIFTRPGSYLGGQSGMTGWILVSKGSIDVQGGRVPVRWVNPVEITDISVQAFYVTLTTKNLRHHADPYLLVDAAFVGNADFDINVGIGVPYPLGSSTTQGVLFSGTVFYRTEGECSTEAQSLVGRTETLPAISSKPRATSLPATPLPASPRPAFMSQRPSESPSPVSSPSSTGEPFHSVPTTIPSKISRSDSLHPTMFPTLMQITTARPTQSPRTKTSSSPTPSPSVDRGDPTEAMSPPVPLVTSLPTSSICLLIPELCNPTTSPSSVPTRRSLEPSMTAPKPSSRLTRPPIDSTKPPMMLRTQAPSVDPDVPAPAPPTLNPTICILIPELCAPTTSPSATSSPVIPKATPKPHTIASRAPADPTRSPTNIPTSAPTAKPIKLATKAPVDPTRTPITKRTEKPTSKPSMRAPMASFDPTRSPTTVPTNRPTAKPITRVTKAPVDPTRSPTTKPTEKPTSKPSRATRAPVDPTGSPITIRTAAPTPKPSRATRAPIDPTRSPITVRTTAPTPKPSRATSAPIDPTKSPTNVRTADPTSKSSRATRAPVDQTMSPTTAGTDVPTAESSRASTAPVDPTRSPTTIQTDAPTPKPPSMATIAPIGPTRAPIPVSTQVPSLDPGSISLSPPVQSALNPTICLLIPELCAQTASPSSQSSNTSTGFPTISPEPTKATAKPSSRATPDGSTKIPNFELSDEPTLAPGMPSMSPPLNPTICVLMPQLCSPTSPPSTPSPNPTICVLMPELCFPATFPSALSPNPPPGVSQPITSEPTQNTGKPPSTGTRTPVGLTSSPVFPSDALPLIIYRPRRTPMPNTPTMMPIQPTRLPPNGSTFNPTFCQLFPALCFTNVSPTLSASPTVTPSAISSTREPTRVDLGSTPSPGLSDQPTKPPSQIQSIMPIKMPAPAESSDEPTEPPSNIESDMPTKMTSPVESEKPAETPSPIESDTPTNMPSPVESDKPTTTPSPAESEVPTKLPSPVESDKPSKTPSPVESDMPINTSPAGSYIPTKIPSSLSKWPSDLLVSPSSRWPVDTPSSSPAIKSSVSPVSFESLTPSVARSETPVMMETEIPTTAPAAPSSLIPTISPVPSTAVIQPDTITPSLNNTELSGIEPIVCPGFVKGEGGIIEETIVFSYSVQTNSSDTISLADLEKQLLLEVATGILSCNNIDSNRLLEQENSTKIYQIGYPSAASPSEMTSCTPTEPTALSCFTIDSAFVLSTNNATAAKGKVLDSIGGIFEDGNAIKNVIPNAVYYHVDDQTLDQPPTSSPVSNTPPKPDISPVSSPTTSPSGFPRQITILLSTVAGLLVLVFAYIVYQKRKKKLRQSQYAATQALFGKDYLENSELYDQNVLPYRDLNDYQHQNKDEPETSSNTDHQDERNEPLGGLIDDRSGSGTGEITTYEVDEGKKSSDDGFSNPDEGDPSDVAGSAVDILRDEKLHVSETGVVTGCIDPETAHSVASDLTDHQTFNGVDTRYESVVTMAQVFDDAEALAEADAITRSMAMVYAVTDVVIVRSLLVLPLLSILFGNVEDLLTCFRNDEVDQLGALVPYIGDMHDNPCVPQAGSDDEQPDTGAHEYIVRLADDDDEPDQPDSCCSSTYRDEAGANAVTARVGVDICRDDDTASLADLNDSESNDDPSLVQDSLTQNESGYPPSRHSEVDSSFVPDHDALSVGDPNSATGNGIATFHRAIYYSEPNSEDYDERNSNHTMSCDSNHGENGGGHDCQPLTSYERNADSERSSVNLEDETNNSNHFRNDYDDGDPNNEEGDDYPYRSEIRYEHSEVGEEHSHEGNCYDDSEYRSKVNGDDDSDVNANSHNNDEHSNAVRICEDCIVKENPAFPHGQDARGNEVQYDQPSINGLDVSDRSEGNHEVRRNSHASLSSRHSSRSGKS